MGLELRHDCSRKGHLGEPPSPALVLKQTIPSRWYSAAPSDDGSSNSSSAVPKLNSILELRAWKWNFLSKLSHVH